MAEGGGKSFIGLLNGITRQQYYNDMEITVELLKEQLYPSLSDEHFISLMNKSTNLIKSMASADMDFNQLEAFLTSQMKRKEGAITEDQAKALAKFWKSHRSKIHESIISRTMWGNTLKSINWRVDIPTHSQTAEQASAPVAIVELQIGNSKDTEAVRFEMDESKLNSLLKNMSEIESQVTKYCQN